MKFVECCSAHDACAGLLQDGVQGHSVAFTELADFNEARRIFARDVKDSALHEIWEEGAKLFAGIHAKLARTPCRPSWLVSEMLDNLGGNRILSALTERLPNVDPQIRKAFEAVLEKLNTLSRVEFSPLAHEIRNSRIQDGRTMFVLSDMQFPDEVRLCLSEALGGLEWDISRPSGLRTMQKADRVFIFSPAWLLTYRGEEYLLRSPVASETHLLACRHEFAGEVRFSLLDESRLVISAGATSGSELHTHSPYEALPLQRDSRFRFKLSAESETWESGRKIMATPFRLGGGHGTYFSRDSHVWIANADFSQGSPLCSGVEKIAVDDLEAGDLVLMTTSGGGDMIPLVADMILADEAQRLRETQSRWKTALRIALHRIGSDEVAKRLKSLGALKATPTNLRNWCNPRSIGMENLDSDLRALLQLVGLESEFGSITDAVEKLRRAHQSAGVQLQKKLRGSLHGKDLKGAFERGSLEIRHGTGPAKTVFLVEERGNEQEIPEEWEGELRELDD
jgi:hypothetical protein